MTTQDEVLRIARLARIEIDEKDLASVQKKFSAILEHFKLLEEVAWFAFVAAGIAVLEILVRFDPQAITNWETWAISLGGSALRAAAAAAIARFAKGA